MFIAADDRKRIIYKHIVFVFLKIATIVKWTRGC